MSLFLLGGGLRADIQARLYEPFLSAASAFTATPCVACVVVSSDQDWPTFERAAAALRAAGQCKPVPILVDPSQGFDISSLTQSDAHALLVCAGHTPSYASALAPARLAIRDWLVAGRRPYAGYSAGAAVVSERAITGGWRLDGVDVCPQAAGEELDGLSVAAGLGFFDWSVDVHASQWGTLSRAVSAVGAAVTARAVAIDEDTMLTLTPETGATLRGLGRVHLVTLSQAGGVLVRSYSEQDAKPLASALIPAEPAKAAKE